jgi:hypothetical protein
MKVAKYETTRSLPSVYQLLFSKAEPLSFDQTWPWFETFAGEALTTEQVPVFYCVELDGNRQVPLAVLPMCRYRYVRGITEPRKLTALSNYYTSSFGLIADRSRADITKVSQRIVDFIANESNRWDIIDLKPLDRDSIDFTILGDALKSAGMIVTSYFRFGNWYLDVAGRSYEEYSTTLPSAVRNTLSRKATKLQKTHHWRVEIISDWARFPTGIADYQTVYGNSWKKAEPFPNFISALARLCLQMGWLRLGILYVAEEPVAAQIWIVKDDIASIFKLAYDKRFGDVSPGSILTSKLMQHVIDVDKVRVVDYLTGDDPYKKDWMSNRRERWGIMAFNKRTLRGMAWAFKEKYASRLGGIILGRRTAL